MSFRVFLRSLYTPFASKVFCVVKLLVSSFLAHWVLWQNNRPKQKSVRCLFSPVCFSGFESFLVSPFFSSTRGMEVTTVRSSSSPVFAGNLLLFAEERCRRLRLILVCRSWEPFATIRGSPSPPFTGNRPPFPAITSPLPFMAHASPAATASPPTDAHVPLVLLVAYEGMCWSPALEPASRQRPLVLAPRQCPPVPAPRKCPPVPAPRKCSPVPLLDPSSSPEPLLVPSSSPVPLLVPSSTPVPLLVPSSSP